MATRDSKFYGQNGQAGASLVTVLVSLAIISIASVSVMGALGSYYEGKRRIDAFESAGEAERMLMGEITDFIRRYVLIQGCTGTNPINFGAYDKTVQLIPGTNAAAVKSQIGRLCRMPSRCPSPVFEKDGAAATSQSAAYGAANNARADCLAAAAVPGSTARDFKNCFKFEPKDNVKTAGRNAFLNPSNQIFFHIRSEILDLRNFTTLTCGSVVANNNNNFRNFSVAGAIAGTFNTLRYSESSILGSGVRHTYSIYWESGPPGNKNYYRKSGVLYVPNNVTR